MSEVLRILKDGYWDRTSVVRTDDGELRVRKERKQTDSPGPWAHQALRNEITYLSEIPEPARSCFPPILAWWDDSSIGYEIPFYADRHDVSQLLREGQLAQSDCDSLQTSLAELLFGSLHKPIEEADCPFADHLFGVIRESIEALAVHPVFSPLVAARTITLNGRLLPGLRPSYHQLLEQDVPAALRRRPTVRLHGDLILENLLWAPLLFIDPVSVAGIDRGDPLFDLVKYESYATGELYAIREEVVIAGATPTGYQLEIPLDHPQLAAFRGRDLTTIFRAAWVEAHGPVNEAHYALLEAYFSLVMARNTTGTHQWARVLMACQCLARATAPV